MPNILIKLFRFLSSLKLAVVVLISFAYVLALGTIQESWHGTAYAKESVYGSWWFSLLMLVLGVNVLCAALSRWPWKKHHTGFVVTHAGIIIVLIGSFITQKWGVDASMALAEGESSDRLTLDETLLQLAAVDENQLGVWKLKYLSDPPTKEKPKLYRLPNPSASPSFIPTEVKVDEYYPTAQLNLRVTEEKEASLENPAFKIVLSGLPMDAKLEMSEWLFFKNNDLQSSEVNLGPAKLSFVTLDKLKAFGQQKLTNVWGQLQLQNKSGQNFQVNLDAPSEKEILIPESPYKIKVVRYLADARVINNQLVSKSNQPNNPALEFKIILADGKEESHLVFANFPELEAVHGKDATEAVFSAKFVLGNAELNPSNLRGEMYFAKDNESLFYRVKVKNQFGPLQKVKVGEVTPTGWMTIQFKVEEFYKNAKAEASYKKVITPPGKSGGPSAIHVIVSQGDEHKSFWMGQGDAKELVLNGAPYLLSYGQRAKLLGFQMRLDDFKVDRYPGTNAAKSYESLVTVHPDEEDKKFQTKIFMNNPLHYKGFTFYQSSYQEGQNGEPDVSIFTVAKDPGTPVKYLGSLLLVAGIALMFWFKPLFMQKRK